MSVESQSWAEPAPPQLHDTVPQAAVHPAVPATYGTVRSIERERRYRRLDAEFCGSFDDAVAQLDLEELLVLEKGRAGPPRTIDEYELIAIKSHSAGEPWWRTRHGTSRRYDYPDHISTNYQEPGGYPYIDAGLAVGLAFRDELRALIALGLQSNGCLRVPQLQAVGPRCTTAHDRFRTGLYSGFRWRETLIAAGCAVAATCKIRSIEIIGAANNSWDEINGKSGGPVRTDCYDDPARAMDFSPTTKGNWRKRLG